MICSIDDLHDLRVRIVIVRKYTAITKIKMGFVVGYLIVILSCSCDQDLTPRLSQHWPVFMPTQLPVTVYGPTYLRHIHHVP
jgi:hypothetical protein